MFPFPSPIDLLIAYASIAVVSVLLTVCVLKYIKKLKAAPRTSQAA